MNDIPIAASGALTIALIVVLGIVGYPALLSRRLGAAIVAVATLGLAVLFYLFDRASGLSTYPVATALALALVPVLIGTIVYRLGRRQGS